MLSTSKAIQPWEGAPWTPRDWQAEALPKALRAIEHSRPVIRAVTGAGKSILIAELANMTAGQVVVTTPSTRLVKDLSETIRARGLRVGRYFTGAKQTRQRVIVCCNDSLPSLAKRIGPPALLIADEAHKSECDTFKDVLLGAKDPLSGERDEASSWVPEKIIGFTATPYRADKAEELSLFDTLAYNYGPAEAMRDGVVVPPRVVHYQGDAKELDDACVEMIHTATGPGIVDALNIADAHEFAEFLNAEGVRAKAVHSKQHDHTIQKRLKKLEAGELDCLVHVSLLSEGVDLPWLRWLCCRRPIGSRVLFAQYIGRGIRVHPGKKYCTVFDPQDLFGKLSLDYDAILSGGVEDDSEGISDLPALKLDWVIDEIRDTDPASQETLRGVPIKAIDPTVSYIRRLRLSFQSMGLISMKMDDADWRREEPTNRQLDRINKYAWLAVESDIPPAHSRALRIAVRAIEGCDRGTASDLISIFNVLEYGWPSSEDGEEVAA